jgi:hypothetical protein
MNYKQHITDSSSLVRDTQRLHDDMISIYNEQIRFLQIRITGLEDENKDLHERLTEHEDKG